MAKKNGHQNFTYNLGIPTPPPYLGYITEKHFFDCFLYEKCAKDAKYSEFAEYAQSADYKDSQSSIHFFIFLLGVS